MRHEAIINIQRKTGGDTAPSSEYPFLYLDICGS